MNRLIIRPVLLIVMALFATGCVYNRANTTDMQMMDGEPDSDAVVNLSRGGPLGGYIEQFMDVNDKSKVSKALDGGVGKTTSWKNLASGANFAVTPTRKVSMGGGICRAYRIKMTKTGLSDKVNGTACVGRDGAWHVAG